MFRAFARTVAQATDAIVVLDTAPTGHTLLLLDASESYNRQLANTTGEVPAEVRALLPRLRDPAFARLVLVTLPESTPVFEAGRLAADLRRAEIEPYGWVVNASCAASSTINPLLARRAAMERRHLDAVATDTDRLWVAGWRAHPPVGATGLRELMG